MEDSGPRSSEINTEAGVTVLPVSVDATLDTDVGMALSIGDAVGDVADLKSMEMQIGSPSSSKERNDEQNENETKIIEDKIVKPTVDMMFDSLEDVYEYYKQYAKQMGFAVRKRSQSRSLDDDRVIHATLVCTRGGKPKSKSKNTFRPRPVTKSGCKARLHTSLCAGGKWRISFIVDDHNHAMGLGKTCFYQCNRVIEPQIRNDDQNGNEIKTIGDKIVKPTVNMIFDSLQDVYDYYNGYAKKMGFAVRKRSQSKSLDDDRVTHATLVCTRGGKPRSTTKNNFRRRPQTRIGCEARLHAAWCANGKWRISFFVDDHNHAMSLGKTSFYRRNRVIEPHRKRKLELNDGSGIRMNKNYNSFVVEAGGHEKVRFLERDCENGMAKVRRLRLGEGDTTVVQNYFTKMHIKNADFFYTMDLDEEGQLKNVFWADARSRAAYEEFGDVIMFDTTYLTSKYDIPIAPFVGVNHHGQSILLGCGLISNEDTDTFTWLFQSLLTCMFGRIPTAIITDQDKAVQNAIEVVFPNARHRWCLWHIMKKLPEKLKGYNEYEPIKIALQNAVCDSLTPMEFDECWKRMIEKFKLGDNDWLTDLYDERHRWVPAFVKNSFWAGMSTTSQSESMHAFFDDHINSKATLKQFLEQYGNVLRSKVEEENLENLNSFNSCVPCLTHYDMEKQLQNAYTNAKFREFQHELIGKMYCELSLVKEVGAISEYEVSEQAKIRESLKHVNFKVSFNKVESAEECEVKCSCCLFEFRGILCRHAISVLIHKGIYYVPAKYIMSRWRKDLKRRHTGIKISHVDMSVKPEARRFDEICNAFYNTAYLAVESEDKFKMMMDWISNIDEKLRKDEGICRSNQPSPMSNSDFCSGDEAKDISKDCPSFKRKLSEIEWFLNREKEKTKRMESKGKTTSDPKRKGSQIMEPKKSGSGEDRPINQVLDVIPMQKCVVIADSQTTQEVHAYRIDGHHSSMLQFHNVPLHLGMPHLPIAVPMFHHNPSRFGQPQLYFGQGGQGYQALDPNSTPGSLVFSRSSTLP